MINKEGCIIRRAVPGDVLGLHQVYFATWLDTYPNQEFNITKDDIVFKYESRLTPDKIAERKEKISQIGENEVLLLVEKNKEIIAVCNAVYEDKCNEIKSFYVLPKYQGLGFGKALWFEAKKIFNPDCETIVKVATYNEKAISFYKKIGFESTGEIIVDERFKMRNGAIIPELKMIIKV
ncbi:MAG: GNAT family N-acetyltransferase [Patescibacteria group bacterium]